MTYEIDPAVDELRHLLLVRRTSGKGLGVFATLGIEQGVLVIQGHLLRASRVRTIHTYQIGWNRHIEMDLPTPVINHSCAPNLGLRNNNFGGFDFISLRDIHPREEVTWDYETTEYISIAVPTCLCGSDACRGQTRGFRYLSDAARRSYGIYIADYLKPLVATSDQDLDSDSSAPDRP